MNRFVSIYFIALAIIITFCFCFFIPVFSEHNSISIFTPNISNISLNLSSSSLIWPTPGYTKVTSGFGYRNSPTVGSSSYHGGIDIGAPERYKYCCL